MFTLQAELKSLKGEMTKAEMDMGLKLIKLQRLFQFNNQIISQVTKQFF